MKSLLFASALWVMATQAAALSCIAPDPIRTFQQVSEADETYYVLYGALEFDEALLPRPGGTQFDRTPAPIAAQFSGTGLTATGFDAALERAITLQITCAGPWCGSAQSGVEAIYFVQAREPDLTVIAGACGGTIFANPTQETRAALTQCMQGGPCSPQPF